ncbi:MAG: hypothetical protein JXR37_11210 [Kiritimatiellae bacterium]|nr:hypothetical protein [Kiritimatiellia bacterium]
MTPRQRVEAVLRGERADRVPFTVYECMLPQCEVERRLRNKGVCIVNRRHPVVKKSTPHVTTETHTYSEGGKQLRRTDYHTPAGDLYTIDQPAGFTSWHAKRLFTRPEDYKPLLFMIRDAELTPCYEAFAAAERALGEDVILRAGVGATPLHQIMIGWMGVETFAVEWMDRRDEIMTLYDALVQQQRRIYPLVAKSPALHANYGGNETGNVMGRERFEQFVVPHYNEAAEIFHQHGKFLGSHLDGNNRVWADLVAGSGLDYIEAFTPAPDCDMTLAEAMAAWPGKVLWINFTSSAHLRPVPGVEAETRKLLQEAAPADRLIVGITEDIPQERWQQNLLAISRVIRAEGRLPVAAGTVPAPAEQALCPTAV